MERENEDIWEKVAEAEKIKGNKKIMGKGINQNGKDNRERGKMPSESRNVRKQKTETRKGNRKEKR